MNIKNGSDVSKNQDGQVPISIQYNIKIDPCRGKYWKLT